jgi:sirohydrochlorin ferrochelatase
MIATLPITEDRVRKNTAPETNQKIQDELEMRLSLYANAGPYQIDRRLEELDEEWDIERVLETNASVLALSGTLLSFVGGRKWLLLPAVVTGFLLQHAIQGWCPPLPLFRRLGVRTRIEIEQERHALKAMRAGFESSAAAAEPQDADQLLRALDA